MHHSYDENVEIAEWPQGLQNPKIGKNIGLLFLSLDIEISTFRPLLAYRERWTSVFNKTGHYFWRPITAVYTCAAAFNTFYRMCQATGYLAGLLFADPDTGTIRNRLYFTVCGFEIKNMLL